MPSGESRAVVNGRIITLDVIRGIAVMGIFSVNVVAFAMIFPAYFNPTAMGLESEADLLTWFANFVVIDGKMRSLFSMLFGASMLLVIDRAVETGRSAVEVHYYRMIVLALIGLLHFYIIWFGDILFLYAVSGMVAFLFRRSSMKTLLGWSAGLFVLSMVAMGGAAIAMDQMQNQAQRPGATSEQVKAWEEASAFGRSSTATTTEAIKTARSSLVSRARATFRDKPAKPFASIPAMLPETLALMLLGMAAYRSGYITGDWPDRDYRRIALWALSLGAIASAVLALFEWQSNFDLPTIFLNFMSLSTPIRVAMALGYAALIILLFRKPSWLRERLAAVGRCAFTNYLGTSILATVIFYGDGLAQFGRWSRFEAWLLVPLVWALMIAWSKPWLDRFQYGPLEWLWRSLSRLERQPMRRDKSDAAPAAMA
jgi:uncharacterized protein